MTELEALAKDCIENHTHKLVDKPTKQDIYLREESIFIQGYRQSEKRIAELEAQIEKMKNCKNCKKLKKEKDGLLICTVGSFYTNTFGKNCDKWEIKEK